MKLMLLWVSLCLLVPLTLIATRGHVTVTSAAMPTPLPMSAPTAVAARGIPTLMARAVSAAAPTTRTAGEPLSKWSE